MKKAAQYLNDQSPDYVGILSEYLDFFNSKILILTIKILFLWILRMLSKDIIPWYTKRQVLIMNAISMGIGYIIFK